MNSENIFKKLYFGEGLRDYSSVAAKNGSYTEALNKLHILEDDIERMSSKTMKKLLEAYRKKEDYIHNAEFVEAFKSGFQLATQLFSQMSH